MVAHDRDQDALARALAAHAGVDWDGLGDYPGYIKALWREQACALRELIETDGSTRRDRITPPR